MHKTTHQKLIKRCWAILSLIVLLGAPCAYAETETNPVARVEPPSWWVGYKNPELQLLVYGSGVSEFSIALDYPGVSITGVEKVTNPNYLFVNLLIADTAQAGTLTLNFSKGEQVIKHDYTLLQKSSDPNHAKGFDSSDAIYLITPDRFANGDTSNDDIDGMREPANRTTLGGRHGGDLQGIRNSLDYIGELGFTAIWLNPVLENNMPAYSYHGYAATDFYRVDPRFGSNEEYRQLTAEAKSKGIGLVMDMIVNHAGLYHWWQNDLPTEDWIHAHAEYTQTSHERMANQDIHASEADKRAFSNGWFDTTMPDLNQKNAKMATYLIQNALWWIEYLGLSGIRMDTYPYPDKDFMTDWTRRLMEEYPQFNIVGEEWSVNPAVVSYWQVDKQNHDDYVSYLPSVMDFPIQATLIGALADPETLYDSGFIKLYRMLANDFLYPHPDQLVVFPDNHDTSRIFKQLGEDPALFEMAMVYFATLRGTPQIYYGTEILMSNRESDDHGLIRSDFPGGWPGDKINGFTGEGLEQQQLDAQQLIRKLYNWRKNTPVLHNGKMTHFLPRESVYVYFRHDEDQQVMVILNKNDTATELEMARFEEILGSANTAHNVLLDKKVTWDSSLSLQPRSATVLEIHTE